MWEQRLAFLSICKTGARSWSRHSGGRKGRKGTYGRADGFTGLKIHKPNAEHEQWHQTTEVHTQEVSELRRKRHIGLCWGAEVEKSIWLEKSLVLSGMAFWQGWCAEMQPHGAFKPLLSQSCHQSNEKEACTVSRNLLLQPFLFSFLKIFFIFYMYRCSACMCVHVPWCMQWQQRPEEDIRLPGSRVTETYIVMGSGTQTWVSSRTVSALN